MTKYLAAIWNLFQVVADGARSSGFSSDRQRSAQFEWLHNHTATPNRCPIVVGGLNRISQDVDMVTLRVNYRFGWDTNPGAVRY